MCAAKAKQKLIQMFLIYACELAVLPCYVMPRESFAYIANARDLRQRANNKIISVDCASVLLQKHLNGLVSTVFCNQMYDATPTPD